MPAQTTTVGRGVQQSAILSAAMFVLTVGGIAYVIIRGGILEERYGKSNLLAHANLYEEFSIAAVLLLAPFIGACSAFRLARLPGRPAKAIGWLLVVTFSLFLFQAILACWSQYQRYANHL
jgi:hypothetical protein